MYNMKKKEKLFVWCAIVANWIAFEIDIVVKILWIKYATRFRIHALHRHTYIQNSNDNEKVLVVILVIEKANLIRNKKNGNINTWQWILDFDSSLQQIKNKNEKWKSMEYVRIENKSSCT